MRKFLAIVIGVAAFTFLILRILTVDAAISGVLSKFIEPSEKFWVHRCNSLEKARCMAESFSGIEIDANFYPEENFVRKFVIEHDYSGEVQITLEDFMPVFASNDSKIWFDFKNLTEANATASLLELENLLENYDIDKARFVVESHNFHALKIYHDAGFYTSFYVTVKKDLDEEIFRDEILAAQNSGCVDAVSFPIDYYKLIKSTGVTLDFLTWQTRGERWWTFYRKSSLREILDDSQVKVILVKMKTSFDRY